MPELILLNRLKVRAISRKACLRKMPQALPLWTPLKILPVALRPMSQCRKMPRQAMTSKRSVSACARGKVVCEPVRLN